MSGAHRDMGQSRVVSARKSAAWLLQGAVLVIGILALLGLLSLVWFAVYRGIAHRADLPAATIVVLGACFVMVSCDLTRLLIRKGPRTPAQFARMIREACQLLGLTVGLFLSLAVQLGWANGTPGDAMEGVGLVLLLAVAAYWVIGERLLRQALERRAAGKQAPSQPS